MHYTSPTGIPGNRYIGSIKSWDKIVLNDSRKMLLSEPLASLIVVTFFNKILSQQSTDARFFLSYNRIQRIKLKNKSRKYIHLTM